MKSADTEARYPAQRGENGESKNLYNPSCLSAFGGDGFKKKSFITLLAAYLYYKSESRCIPSAVEVELPVRLNFLRLNFPIKKQSDHVESDSLAYSRCDDESGSYKDKMSNSEIDMLYTGNLGNL